MLRKKNHKWLIRTTLTTLCLAGLFTTVSVINNGPSATLASAKTTAKKTIGKIKPKQTVSQRLGIDLARAIARKMDTTKRLPSGKGIVIAQVEGQPGNYMPNKNDPNLKGVSFIQLDGPSKISGHANFVAKQIVGKTGTAPGIKRVYALSSAGFLGNQCLKVGSATPPNAHNRRIYTHSWIQGGRGAYVEDALKRIDYLIDQQDVIMVVGVNNSRKTAVPAMLASAYNVISVGTWNGDNSNGYTPNGVTGAGRCKPDVVAPSAQSSFSTPMVAGVAARLLEYAYESDQPGAYKSEVIKALIIGGAQQFNNFKPAKGKPLAKQVGAGRVRYDRSYLMQLSANQKPGKIRQSNAWAFQSLAPKKQHSYEFTLRGDCPEIAATLVFNRKVVGKKMKNPKTNSYQWLNKGYLANLDLSLVHIDESGLSTAVKISNSKIDNVEQVIAKNLKPGRYRITVSRVDNLKPAWEYALVWRMD